MSLVANLDKIATSIKTAETLVEKIKQDSRAALNPKQFINENSKKVVAAARKDIEQASLERSKIFLGDISKQRDRLESYIKSRRPKNETLQFLRAERINQAKDIEEAISIYKRNIGRMSKEDQEACRPIYDDSLLEYVARVEPEAAYLAEGAIDEFRTDIEKHYIEELKIAHEIFQNSKIIDSQIEEQLKALERGESPINFDWPKVVNQIRENAKHNIRGVELPQELKINPYDEGTEEVEAEEAAAAE